MRCEYCCCFTVFHGADHRGPSSGLRRRARQKFRQKNPLKNVYFGEQHLHTQDSADAFSMGTRNSQDDAYNFCKGKVIKKVTLS